MQHNAFTACAFFCVLAVWLLLCGGPTIRKIQSTAFATSESACIFLSANADENETNTKRNQTNEYNHKQQRNIIEI